jgi:tetratricopeptide (TPR) repeat protein
MIAGGTKQPMEAAARWRTIVGGGLIALAAVAAYANTFHCPVGFDDLTSIPDNPTIRSLGRAWLPPPAGHGGLSVAGRPLLNFTLGLNYAWSRYDPWSYHALNLGIHLLAGLTLFGLLRRTFKLPPLAARFGRDAWALAAVIALLWTVHPLQTEAVTYVIQRAESLMGLFFLLTLYGFVRALDSPQPHLWRTLSVLACLAGVATKEIAALAPVLVLLYDRTFVSGSLRAAWRKHRWHHLALAATWLPLAGLLASTGGDRGGTFSFSDPSIWAGHALSQFEAVIRYFQLTFWPHPLVFDYGQIFPPTPGRALLWALPVLALLGATLLAWQRWPAAGFLGAWVFLILAPTSALPATLQIIVEHRMYLPSAALLTLAATGAYLLAGRAAIAALLVLALGAGLLTARRNEDYRSDLVLWADTVAKRPESARAHNNLGYAFEVRGRLSEALGEYEAAIRLDPLYPDIQDNLGCILAKLPGRLPEAIAHYEAAIRLKPDFPKAYFDLGAAWAQVPGREADAISAYQSALRLRPDYVEAHGGLGNAWLATPGHLADAAAEYQAALRLNPDSAEAHFALGCCWVRMPDRLSDAIAQFSESLRLKPDFPEAHYNLGNAWAHVPGHMDDAVAQYQAALRLKPEFVDAHLNLGNALSSEGRLAEAAAQYKETLRLQPSNDAARRMLGRIEAGAP